jgi:hypothetical protein
MSVEEQCPVFTPVMIFGPFMQSWATEEKKRCNEAFNASSFNTFASIKRFIASSL